MRKVIEDYSPNTASTLNEVQKILLTNGLLTKPTIVKIGNDLYISKFLFINNGIIIETDPVKITQTFPSTFYIYAYVNNASPDDLVKYYITSQDYKYENIVKIAYYDGTKFIIEDTVSPKEIFKYVNSIETDRGFVTEISDFYPIEYDNINERIVIRKGQIISRFGKKIIDDSTILFNRSNLFLTANNVNSRICYRLLYRQIDDLVLEGISHIPETIINDTILRDLAPGYNVTIRKGEPVDVNRAAFITDDTTRAIIVYDSITNEISQIVGNDAAFNDIQTIYNKRIFAATFTANSLNVISWDLNFANAQNISVTEIEALDSPKIVINPLINTIYGYGIQSTNSNNLILHKITYSSSWVMTYKTKIVIDMKATISNIVAVYKGRKTQFYVSAGDILYKVEIDENDSYTIDQISPVQTFIAKNSIDGDSYLLINPSGTRDLLIFRNDEPYAVLNTIFSSTSVVFYATEIFNNNRIYLTCNDGGSKIYSIINTRNKIYYYYGSLNNTNLSRSGAMLLTYKTDVGGVHIQQINIDYTFDYNISFLPECLEDNTLAIIYQDTGVTGMTNPAPVVKTNRIDIYNDDNFIGRVQSKNTCLDLSKVLDELYSLYPDTTIHLRIANGIYIDSPVTIRGDTILEGVFYVNQDKLAARGVNYVFSSLRDSIPDFSATQTSGNYYYIRTTCPYTRSSDYFYGISGNNLTAKYKIIERVNSTTYLAFCEQPPTGGESYYLISNNIIFKNSKFIPSMQSTNRAWLTHENLNVSFENCFISKSIIRGKSIKLENCEFENTYFNIQKSEKIEIIKSKALNTADGYLIEGNPLYPCKIIIENNDLSVYTNAEALFKSDFDFANTNLTKIIIENNDLQDSYIDGAYINILRPSPLKIRMHEGSVPSSLFITQGNRYRIVTGTKEQAKTFGTPYYGPDGLEKAFNDINPYETIVVKGTISQVTGNPIKVININQKPFSLIGDTGDTSTSPNSPATLYRIKLVYTPNLFPAQDIIEVKNLRIQYEYDDTNSDFLNIPLNEANTYSFGTIEFKNCQAVKARSLINIQTPNVSGATFFGDVLCFDRCIGNNSTFFRCDASYLMHYFVKKTLFKNCSITINDNVTGYGNKYGRFLVTSTNFAALDSLRMACIVLKDCCAFLDAGSWDKIAAVQKFVEFISNPEVPFFLIFIDGFQFEISFYLCDITEQIIYINRAWNVMITNSYFIGSAIGHMVPGCRVYSRFLHVNKVYSYGPFPCIYYTPIEPYDSNVVLLSTCVYGNSSGDFIRFTTATAVRFSKVNNFNPVHYVEDGSSFEAYVDVGNV